MKNIRKLSIVNLLVSVSLFGTSTFSSLAVAVNGVEKTEIISSELSSENGKVDLDSKAAVEMIVSEISKIIGRLKISLTVGKDNKVYVQIPMKKQGAWGPLLHTMECEVVKDVLTQSTDFNEVDWKKCVVKMLENYVKVRFGSFAKSVFLLNKKIKSVMETWNSNDLENIVKNYKLDDLLKERARNANS